MRRRQPPVMLNPPLTPEQRQRVQQRMYADPQEVLNRIKAKRVAEFWAKYGRVPNEEENTRIESDIVEDHVVFSFDYDDQLKLTNLKGDE